LFWGCKILILLKNLIKFAQILITFAQICPHFAKISPKFYPKKFLMDAAAIPAPAALIQIVLFRTNHDEIEL